MDVVLRVNRVSTHSVKDMVPYQGEMAEVMLQELEVELHDETAKHGSITLRFRRQAEVADAKAMFSGGDMVKLSFEKCMSINTDLSAPAPEQPAA